MEICATKIIDAKCACRYVPSADLELGDALSFLDADMLDVLARADHSHEILDFLELLRHVELYLSSKSSSRAKNKHLMGQRKIRR